MSRKVAPPPGVYAPTLCFWKNKWNADPDLDTFRKHLTRLVDDGVMGIDLFSYWGEGPYVSPEERKQFLRVANEVLKPHDKFMFVECGTDSLWETLERLKEAHDAEADYAMIAVPAVYEAEMVSEDVFAYFHQLSESSLVPFIIRAPATSSPLAFTLDSIRQLRRLPKCVGILMPPFDPLIAEVAKDCLPGDDFAIFCTYPGDLGRVELKIRLQTAMANVTPFAMSEMYKSDEDREGEIMTQIMTTKVFREIATRVTGLKYAMTRVRAYGGTCRPPLPVPSRELRAKIDPILPSLAGDFFRNRWMRLKGIDLEDSDDGSASEGAITPRVD